MSEGVNGQIYRELHSKEKITQNVQKIWKDSLQNTHVKSQQVYEKNELSGKCKSITKVIHRIISVRMMIVIILKVKQ